MLLDKRPYFYKYLFLPAKSLLRVCAKMQSLCIALNLALCAYFGTMRQIWRYPHILVLYANLGAMLKNPRTYAPHANARFAPA